MSTIVELYINKLLWLEILHAVVHLVNMNDHMGSKIGLNIETLVANVTLERLLPCVYPHVSGHLPVKAKRSLANRAGKLVFIRVGWTVASVVWKSNIRYIFDIQHFIAWLHPCDTILCSPWWLKTIWSLNWYLKQSDNFLLNMSFYNTSPIVQGLCIVIKH